MIQLCMAAGFTRQAHFAYIRRRYNEETLYNLVQSTVSEVRSLHPQMGLKKIFHLIEPDIIGRDKFLEIGSALGLKLPRTKNYQRTTYSNKCANTPNLTTNLEIRDINQVWVSDITYFYVNNVFYYLTFIEDVYSRRILGFVASPTLQAQANCRAIRKAIKTRNCSSYDNLIHHSDRGTQYTSKEYLNILKEHNISVSLCDSVYENSHIERVNGIIKNEYLYCYHIGSFSKLKSRLRKAVYLYNFKRPHWSLDCMTPVEYEKSLISTAISKRKPLIMFTDNSKDILKKYYQGALFDQNCQPISGQLSSKSSVKRVEYFQPDFE